MEILKNVFNPHYPISYILQNILSLRLYTLFCPALLETVHFLTIYLFQTGWILNICHDGWSHLQRFTKFAIYNKYVLFILLEITRKIAALRPAFFQLLRRAAAFGCKQWGPSGPLFQDVFEIFRKHFFEIFFSRNIFWKVFVGIFFC